MATNAEVLAIDAKEREREAWRHERFRPLVKQLLASGLIEETCEELQAQLVQQWLSCQHVEDREKCWHEVRAVEFVRETLCAKLADPREEAYAKLVESTASWRRWVRKVKQWT